MTRKLLPLPREGDRLARSEGFSANPEPLLNHLAPKQEPLHRLTPVPLPLQARGGALNVHS